MFKRISDVTTFLLVISFLFLALLTSCAMSPEKAYSGPDQPDEEIAIITDSNPWNPIGFPIFIKYIDDYKVVNSPVAATKYTILPGRHKLQVRCYTMGDEFIGKSIYFEAKPGRTYEFRHSLDCQKIFVLDSQSDEVVGSIQ